MLFLQEVVSPKGGTTIGWDEPLRYGRGHFPTPLICGPLCYLTRVPLLSSLKVSGPLPNTIVPHPDRDSSTKNIKNVLWKKYVGSHKKYFKVLAEENVIISL